MLTRDQLMTRILSGFANSHVREEDILDPRGYQRRVDAMEKPNKGCVILSRMPPMEGDLAVLNVSERTSEFVICQITEIERWDSKRDGGPGVRFRRRNADITNIIGTSIFDATRSIQINFGYHIVFGIRRKDWCRHS